MRTRKALEIDKIQGTKYQAPNSNIPNINLHDRNHEQNIAKIGYGRVLAGQSYEALRYNPKSESIFLDATARKKYVHERKVADIGYGRVLRGMMVACIDCTD
ncbi:hypothetical protein HDU83_003416 [Entophlyctis luteolus]|nr:hypothetical protein HDU83_003416 [Entophlyctis luteolus]